MGHHQDVLYNHPYSLSPEELAYILDTFPIVRRKDEAQYGEYRTKRLVLEAYKRVGETGWWIRASGVYSDRRGSCEHHLRF